MQDENASQKPLLQPGGSDGADDVSDVNSLNGAKRGCACCCATDPSKRLCCCRSALRCCGISCATILIIAGGLVGLWFIIYGGAADVIKPHPDTVDCHNPDELGQFRWSVVNDPAVPVPPPPAGLRRANASFDTIELLWNLTEDTTDYTVLGYELQRDNWFISGAGNYKSILCANRSQSNFSCETFLLPASNYSFRIRSNTTNGVSDFSPVVNITTAGHAGCGNPTDVDVFYNQFQTIKLSMQGCLAKSGLDRDKTVTCMHKDLGMTTDCGACFTDHLGLCSLKQCMPACVLPNSAACLQCSLKQCIPDTVTCSGLPLWLVLELP